MTSALPSDPNLPLEKILRDSRHWELLRKRRAKETQRSWRMKIALSLRGHLALAAPPAIR